MFKFYFIRFKLFIKYNSLYNSFITLSKYLIFFDQLVSNFVSFEIFIKDMNLLFEFTCDIRYT